MLLIPVPPVVTRLRFAFVARFTFSHVCVYVCCALRYVTHCRLVLRCYVYARFAFTVYGCFTGYARLPYVVLHGSTGYIRSSCRGWITLRFHAQFRSVARLHIYTLPPPRAHTLRTAYHRFGSCYCRFPTTVITRLHILRLVCSVRYTRFTFVAAAVTVRAVAHTPFRIHFVTYVAVCCYRTHLVIPPTLRVVTTPFLLRTPGRGLCCVLVVTRYGCTRVWFCVLRTGFCHLPLTFHLLVRGSVRTDRVACCLPRRCSSRFAFCIRSHLPRFTTATTTTLRTFWFCAVCTRTVAWLRALVLTHVPFTGSTLVPLHSRLPFCRGCATVQFCLRERIPVLRLVHQVTRRVRTLPRSSVLLPVRLRTLHGSGSTARLPCSHTVGSFYTAPRFTVPYPCAPLPRIVHGSFRAGFGSAVPHAFLRYGWVRLRLVHTVLPRLRFTRALRLRWITFCCGLPPLRFSLQFCAYVIPVYCVLRSVAVYAHVTPAPRVHCPIHHTYTPLRSVYSSLRFGLRTRLQFTRLHMRFHRHHCVLRSRSHARCNSTGSRLPAVGYYPPRP